MFHVMCYNEHNVSCFGLRIRESCRIRRQDSLTHTDTLYNILNKRKEAELL